MTQHQPDPLHELFKYAAAMWHGRAAFDQRLDELVGGYPSAGEGSPGNAALGGPTAAAVVADMSPCRACEKAKRTCPPAHKVKPADKAKTAWERHIAQSLEEAGKAWAVYAAVANERLGVAMVKDPGCDLCAKVPCENPKCRCAAIDNRHWCPVFGSVEVVEKGARGAITKRIYKLCVSCHDFQRPRCAGRLPSHDEVLDHVEGRKRRWKAS